MSRVLVTGATGFIGGHLVRALVERGDDVTCLVRREVPIPGARVVLGDMTAPSSLPAALREAEVVYHLASLLKVPWRREFHTVNVEGTRNVAAACAAMPTPPVLVVVSSLAAAGPAPEGPDQRPRSELDLPVPVSIYGRVKLAAEEAARSYSDRVPLTIVRPPGVFGGGDRSFLKLFRSVERGLHVLPSRRTTSMSMIHAPELAKVLLLAATRGERATTTRHDAGVYFYAHAEQPAYADLGALVASAMGRPPPIVIRLPGALTWLAAALSELAGRLRDTPTFLNLDKWREGTAGSWTISIEKARRDLGASPVPLASALRETAEAYRAAGWIL